MAESEGLGAVHWSLQQAVMPRVMCPAPQDEGSSAIHLIYEGSRNLSSGPPSSVQSESWLLRKRRKTVRNDIQIQKSIEISPTAHCCQILGGGSGTTENILVSRETLSVAKLAMLSAKPISRASARKKRKVDSKHTPRSSAANIDRRGKDGCLLVMGCLRVCGIKRTPPTSSEVVCMASAFILRLQIALLTAIAAVNSASLGAPPAVELLRR